MKKYVFPLVFLSLSSPAAVSAQEVAAETAATEKTQSFSGQVSGIVAVVNDDVISSRDLGKRIALVLGTTQLSNTPEVRARLAPQVLRSLMDEKLQLQAATRSGIEVTPADLEKGVRGIEEQRRMEPGTLFPRLQAMGVPLESFKDQLKAQIAWTKTVLQTIRPRVKVADAEVERERTKLVQPGASTAEVLVMVLALGVSKPEEEKDIAALAEKLAAEIKGGVPFESVVQGLSGPGMTDKKEVKPFWLPLDQAEPDLAAAITSAELGSVIGPVRTTQGYVVMNLMDRRDAAAKQSDAEVLVKDILLRLPPDARETDTALLMNKAEAIARVPGTCSDTVLPPSKNYEAGEFDSNIAYRREKLQNLPPQMRTVFAGLEVGATAGPFPGQEGVRVLMLCERMEKPAGMAEEEETRDRLFRQKLDLESQKHLRSLRRDATIDIRI